MIDEKGRLFGKVNIVDLAIVLVILAAAAYLGLTFLGPDSTAATTQEVLISFYYEECPDYVADSIEIGASIWDSSDNVTIGTVLSTSQADSITYLLDDDGQTVQTSKDGYCALTVTATAQGVLSDYGVTIGGTLYGIGHTLTMYAGNAKLYLKVSAIEAA